MGYSGVVSTTTCFDQDEQGTVQLLRADARVFISQQLLDDDAVPGRRQGEGLVRFDAANGYALYRLEQFYGSCQVEPDSRCVGPGWTATLVRATFKIGVTK